MLRSEESYSICCPISKNLKNAVIYCRVSSKKQVKEGHGLSSQETACRKYAEDQGFVVRRVFTDDFTGGGDFWHRLGIRSLLEYLNEQDGETAVIFDDIKRFARDTIFHLKLRKELSARNAQPYCPTFRFDDTPEGEFVETIIAATAQLERQQNRLQVIRRMKARFQAGHWMFPPPIGYKRIKRNGEKIMVPDESCCDVVREALERYAAGSLVTQRDVARHLEAHSCRSKWSQGSTYSPQATQRFLGNELYAGWCVCDKWKMRVRGVHKPLISQATHNRILSRLQSSARPHVRKDASREFSLRGFVHCAACSRQITAYWAQGRNKKYPYYRCLTSGCVNIRMEMMEELFAERLREAKPTAGAFRLLEADLLEIAQDRQLLRNASEKHTEDQLSEIDRETQTLMKSVRRAANPTVQKLYEDQVEKLQTERERLVQQAGVHSDLTIEPILEKGRELLRDPLQYWQRGNLQRRYYAQNLVFKAPILFDRNTGYRTAEFSLLYRLMRASKKDKSSMVDLLRQSLNPMVNELRRWTKILASKQVRARRSS